MFSVALLSEQRRLLLWLAPVTLLFLALEGVSIMMLFPLLKAFDTRSFADPSLRRWVALLLAVILAKSFAEFTHRLGIARLHNRLLVSIRERVCQTYLGIDAMDIFSREPSEIVYLYSKQTSALAELVLLCLEMGISSILAGVYVCGLLYYDPKIAGVGLGLGALTFSISIYFKRRIHEMGESQLRADTDATRLVLDDLTGMSLIRVLGIRSARMDLHRASLLRFFQDSERLNRWISGSGPLHDVIVGVLLLGGILVLSAFSVSLPSVGSLLAALLVLHRLQGRFAFLSGGMASAGELSAQADQVLRFIEKDTPSISTLRSKASLVAIEAKGINFRYPNGSFSVGPVSFRLQSGVTALMGPNASGKSTLCRIIAGLYRPQRGSVTYFGMNGQSWSSPPEASIGWVTDDGFVFSESLEWNIRCGRKLEAAAIRKSAIAVGIDEWIQTLPEKYETKLGPSHIVLSSGQRQRLAMARALAETPAILILDEAMRSIDAESLADLSRVLLDYGRERIVFIVTHDPEFARLADRVWTMKDLIREEPLLTPPRSVDLGTEPDASRKRIPQSRIHEEDAHVKS